MKSAIISPAYNVERYIGEFVRLTSPTTNALVVVNDGSTDDTRRLLERLLTGTNNLHVIHIPRNRGKAEAVATGIRYVLNNINDTDVMFQMDADLAHAPTDIAGFLNQSTEYDLVVGNRYADGAERDEHRSCVMNLASMAVSAATRIRLHDPMCGYRRISKRAAALFADCITHHGYGVETEQLVLCHLNKYLVAEHDLAIAIPQDIKTKAIEFIDVFTVLVAYAPQLALPDDIVRAMSGAIDNLKARRNFTFSIEHESIAFRHVPYEDSYALSWATQVGK